MPKHTDTDVERNYRADLELRAAEIAAEHVDTNGMGRIMSSREGLGWAAHNIGIAADDEDAQELCGWLARQIVAHELPGNHEATLAPGEYAATVGRITVSDSSVAYEMTVEGVKVRGVAVADDRDVFDSGASVEAMLSVLGDDRYAILITLSRRWNQEPSRIITRAFDQLASEFGHGAAIERINRRRPA